MNETKLGNILKNIKDKYDPTKEAKYDIPYIGLENIEKGKGIISIGKADDIKSIKTKFKKGDLLYGKLRPYLDKHDIADFDGICSTDILVYRAENNVTAKWINYFMSTTCFIDYAIENSNGINLPRTSDKAISLCSIPLPPLETQKRIVDRIESLFAKLDEAKEKAQTALDTFELRKSAILHKAFTGELTAQWRVKNQAVAVTSEHSDNLTSTPTEGSNGVTSYSEDSNNVTPSSVEYPNNLISVPSSLSNNPKQSDTDSVEQDADKCEKSMDLNENFKSRLSVYNIATLKEISQKITDGEHKTPKRIESFNGFYLLSARNIHDNFIKLDDVDYVDEDEFNRIRKRCNPDKGDILISCSGSVGRVCVIQDTNKYVMVRSAAMIKLRSDNSFYVSYMLQSPNVQKQIDKTKKQSCQANLFLGAIAQLRIPLPPLPEQQEIVRILDDLLAKENAAKEAAEAVIEKIDLMKKSILARAFRGEL